MPHEHQQSRRDGIAMSAPPDRGRTLDDRQPIADALASAVVVVLPWSISGALLFILLWLFAVVATLGPARIHRGIMTIAGGAPILLLFLGVIGMLWANVTWAERLGGADSFLKLLAIPLLFAQFRQSDRASWLLIGFLSSCTVLLAVFWAAAIRDTIAFHGAAQPALIKNATTEMSEFIICGFVSLAIAIKALYDKRRLLAAGMVVLAGGFLAIVFYVLLVPGYWFVFPFETLLPIAALLLLLALKQFGAKVSMGLLAIAVITCSLVYVASPSLRSHINAIELLGVSRPVYWSKSVQFVAEAPILGHGTGSIHSLFALTAKGQSGPMAEVATNPFQETLAIGIQLGIIGVAALWTMWISHLLLFRGQSLPAWIGSIIVVYLILGSMFDSQIFDAHRGWTYVFGVGVAGGVILRKRIS
jgi:O-antigen ligase